MPACKKNIAYFQGFFKVPAVNLPVPQKGNRQFIEVAQIRTAPEGSPLV